MMPAKRSPGANDRPWSIRTEGRSSSTLNRPTYKIGTAPFPLLKVSRKSYPFVEKAFADSAHSGDKPQNASVIDIEIVRKPPDQIGFAVHPRRWVVERLFGWISRNRRLWNDPEATIASATAVLYAASVMIRIRRLGRAS